jgi:ATP-dependent Clp protease ATP-binding subunit ClpC
MPDIEFDIAVVTKRLEENRQLAEALLFPEIVCFGDDSAHLHTMLIKQVVKKAEALLPLDLQKRFLPCPPELRLVTLSIKPLKQSIAWQEPVVLSFDVVQWSHGERPHIAFVPALGIEVIAKQEEDLDKRIRAGIRFALMREEMTRSLQGLVHLSRYRETGVDTLSVQARLQTPKQHAMAAANDTPTKPSRLQEVATDMVKVDYAPAYDVEDTLRHMADALTGKRPSSILLVGPPGVGKTAVIGEMVQQRRRLGLSQAQFWSTSGARLVSGMSGFGAWQERCTELCREISEQRVILYLGNLMELMEVGRYEGNSQGIASFLTPSIGRGDIVVVAECAPEQVSLIEQTDPRLLGVFRQIGMDPPNTEKGRAILGQVAMARARAGQAPISDEGLDELERLHRRYATYSAQPGRAVQFLHHLLRDHPHDHTVLAQDVTTAFSRETGLPALLIDDRVPLNLDTTRQWFAERIMGQPEAIDLVVGLLATAKLALSRPEKPLASLLFIGPTGVGKTEMAKTLAAFLFGARQRMIRFDMSEYADPASVAQLIGGPGGSEGLLTAKVRETPFSVVLLDEFEKADPAFFDLLLQVLGEGRLTDASGRQANFCNCVVIMTSNLGATSFQKGPLGFVKDKTGAGEAKHHFIEEVRSHLRPELFNRIDHIVPFEPLSAETVYHIAKRELQAIRVRDGIRLRGVHLDIPEEVVSFLAQKGYDPRYGARSLKRLIERELLVRLAEGINTSAVDLNLHAEVRVEGAHLAVTVRACEPGKVRPNAHQDDASVRTDNTQQMERMPLARMSSLRITLLRRKVQTLEQCSVVRDLQNDLYAAERTLARAKSHKKTLHTHHEEDQAELTRLPKLQESARLLDRLKETVVDLEGRMLIDLYRPDTSTQAVAAKDLTQAEQDFRALLVVLYALQYKEPDTVTLALFSEDTDALILLAQAYYEIARRLGLEVHMGLFFLPRAPQQKGKKTELASKRDAKTSQKTRETKETNKSNEANQGDEIETPKKRESPLQHHPIGHPDKFLQAPPEKVLGVSLAVTGPAALPRFELERGTHQMVKQKKKIHCLVDVSELAIKAYVPPEGIERKGAIRSQHIRRRYDMDTKAFKEKNQGRAYNWAGRDISPVLHMIMEQNLIEAVTSMVTM